MNDSYPETEMKIWGAHGRVSTGQTTPASIKADQQEMAQRPTHWGHQANRRSLPSYENFPTAEGRADFDDWLNASRSSSSAATDEILKRHLGMMAQEVAPGIFHDENYKKENCLGLSRSCCLGLIIFLAFLSFS